MCGQPPTPPFSRMTHKSLKPLMPWAAVVGSRHLILSTEFLFSWLSILAAPSDRMGDVARYMGMIS